MLCRMLSSLWGKGECRCTRVASWQFLRCVCRQNWGINNEVHYEFLLSVACQVCCCMF